jgi:Flp pilus assembly protein TadB
MAQTKRKRQSKHRGNAAGVIESRGRTGRKPTAAEKSGDSRALAREKDRLLDKRDRPPSWRAAFVKAMVAGAVLLFVVIIFLKQANQAIGLFPVVIVFYTVVSYYTDKWMYERRQRKKASGTAGGRTTR